MDAPPDFSFGALLVSAIAAETFDDEDAAAASDDDDEAGAASASDDDDDERAGTSSHRGDRARTNDKTSDDEDAARHDDGDDVAGAARKSAVAAHERARTSARCNKRARTSALAAAHSDDGKPTRVHPIASPHPRPVAPIPSTASSTPSPRPVPPAACAAVTFVSAPASAASAPAFTATASTATASTIPATAAPSHGDGGPCTRTSKRKSISAVKREKARGKQRRGTQRQRQQGAEDALSHVVRASAFKRQFRTLVLAEAQFTMAEKRVATSGFVGLHDPKAEKQEYKLRDVVGKDSKFKFDYMANDGRYVYPHPPSSHY